MKDLLLLLLTTLLLISCGNSNHNNRTATDTKKAKAEKYLNKASILHVTPTSAVPEKVCLSVD